MMNIRTAPGDSLNVARVGGDQSSWTRIAFALTTNHENKQRLVGYTVDANSNIVRHWYASGPLEVQP